MVVAQRSAWSHADLAQQNLLRGLSANSAAGKIDARARRAAALGITGAGQDPTIHAGRAL
jgi:hypothetical protein